MIASRPTRRRPPWILPAAALLVAVLALLPVPAAEAPEPPFSIGGKVVAVYDGDTLTVLANREQHKIRVSSIDTRSAARLSGRGRSKRRPGWPSGRWSPSGCPKSIGTIVWSAG